MLCKVDSLCPFASSGRAKKNDTHWASARVGMARSGG
jgi:hypothetical protein